MRCGRCVRPRRSASDSPPSQPSSEWSFPSAPASTPARSWSARDRRSPPATPSTSPRGSSRPPSCREILIGAETYRLVRDAVEVEPVEPLGLKGKAEPVPAYRLVTVDPAAVGGRPPPRRAARRAGNASSTSCDAHTSEPWTSASCDLFTLLGPAGVGKSRLAAEFLAGVEREATVVRGRCLHYGEGITFWPLVEMLMQLGDVAAADARARHRGRDGLAGGPVLAGAPAARGRRGRAAARRRVRRPALGRADVARPARSCRRPLARLAAPAALHRPPRAPRRPCRLGGGKAPRDDRPARAARRRRNATMLDSLGDGLDAETRSAGRRRLGGQPAVPRGDGGAGARGGDVAVPPTIQALLTARLEQLREEERAVIERGAVEGKVFHRGAVRELASEALRPQVEGQLAALVRKELIRPEPTILAGEDAFRFRHLLIRDAAYEALPKEVRAELHERFAGWLVLRRCRPRRAGRDRRLAPGAGGSVPAGARPAGGAASWRRARESTSRRQAARRRRASTCAAVDKLLTRSLELLDAGHAGRPAVAVALAEALTDDGPARPGAWTARPRGGRHRDAAIRDGRPHQRGS